MIVWINLKFNRWCLNPFLLWARKAWDVEQQVWNKSSNGSVREETLNDENPEQNFSLWSRRSCHTYIAHLYFKCIYKCNYVLAHKHLQEFLLHFKDFQSANLGNITDMTGRLGATSVFKIIANACLKERFYLARLSQEPRERCRNGSKAYTFQSVPFFNSHYFVAWASVFRAGIYMSCSLWVFESRIVDCVGWMVGSR